MNKYYLKKIVYLKKRKTYKRSFIKSQLKLEQDKEKLGPLEKKTSPKLYLKGKTKLEELLAQLQKCGKISLFTHL